jgi:hypothetical protein
LRQRSVIENKRIVLISPERRSANLGTGMVKILSYIKSEPEGRTMTGGDTSPVESCILYARRHRLDRTESWQSRLETWLSALANRAGFGICEEFEKLNSLLNRALWRRAAAFCIIVTLSARSVLFFNSN